MKAAILHQLGTRIIGVIATGQGGTGKTRALRGLATDEDMKTAFPGGALYIQLGNNANVLSVFNGIATIVKRTGNDQLARQLRGFKSLHDAVETAATWFHG